MTWKKRNGVYYTPNKLVDYLAKKCLENFEDKKEVSILEPSCGDARFIDSILKYSPIKQKLNIDLVEKNISEQKKLNKKFAANKNININHRDYLNFHFESNKKYDLIIGNPPYVHKKSLSKNQIEKCEKIHKESDLKKTIKNLWVAFLVSATQKIKDEGIVCFVLPSEIMQVEYAKELRKLLIKEFDEVEIITFNELVFEGIEQDATTIIAKKKSKNKKMIFTEFESLNDLEINNVKNTNSVSKEYGGKWNAYVLNDSEMQLLQRLSSNLKSIGDISDSKPGIVSGANSYFILNNDFIKKHNIQENCDPILQKSFHFSHGVIFREKDFLKIKEDLKPCYIINVQKEDKVFERKIERYINEAKEKKIHLRYKCSIRKPWYAIPSIEKSPAFFFKRTHRIPKIIFNEADILVTDGAYKIDTKKGYDLKSLIFSFYTTLTLLFTELNGRFYGGGVLELTPSEFRSLPIPYLEVPNKMLKVLDKHSRENKMEEIIFKNDLMILHEKLNFTNSEIKKLQKIRKKLMNRRLKE